MKDKTIARKKRFLRQIVILLVTPIVGLLSLYLVHKLPTEMMREHVYWSMDLIADEFEDETVVRGYRATLTGNFTDCLMLEHAIYDHKDHSDLEQVLHMYRAESFYDPSDPDGWQPGESLRDYVNFVPATREVEYGRYWHGYLVFLKPLLLITGVGSVRMLFSALQLLLTVWIVVLMTEKRMKHEAVGFAFSLPFMFFISTFASMSLSICFYLVQVSMIVMLKNEGGIEKRAAWPELFLLIGMATSYFDFLTYPVVTLGFPMTLYYLIKMKNEKEASEKKKTGALIGELLILSAEWGSGYGFMWAAKWLIAALLGHKGLIKDAVDTVFVRLQSAEGVSRGTGFFKVVRLNMGPFLNWGYFLLGIVGLTIAIVFILRNINFRKIEYGYVLIFFLIALYPFIWYLLLENHSEQHFVYTCRNLAVTVFALACTIITLREETK